MGVKERFALLSEKVEIAAQNSGRKRSDITIIAVSKYASLCQMEESYRAGIRIFGESRLQVALAKQKTVSWKEEVFWHFVGPIQSNKALSIGASCSCLHSISSVKIAKKLSDYGLTRGEKVSCFLEVNILKDALKQGFFAEEIERLQEELFTLEGLQILGLMTMGPHTKKTEEMRQCFRAVAALRQHLPKTASFLSMGMSGDFSVAIEEGATHIRIGSYLYGE